MTTTGKCSMEEMEEERLDDHNHNYRDGTRDAYAFMRSQLSNEAQLFCSPMISTDPTESCSGMPPRRELRYMDSDSSSISSETSDTDSPSASASTPGKLTLNSATKFCKCDPHARTFVGFESLARPICMFCKVGFFLLSVVSLIEILFQEIILDITISVKLLRLFSCRLLNNLRLLWCFDDLVMNSMTVEDYKNVYWPKLESAIEHLLTQSPSDHNSISYEQIYR